MRPLLRLSLKDLREYASSFRIQSAKESTTGQSMKDIPMYGITNLATKTTVTGTNSGFKRLEEDDHTYALGDGVSSKGLIHTYHTVDVDVSARR